MDLLRMQLVIINQASATALALLREGQASELEEALGKIQGREMPPMFGPHARAKSTTPDSE